MSKRDNYVEKMKLQLDTMNTEITAFEARAHQMGTTASEKIDEEMARLREQSRAATSKLDELVAASEATWHKMVGDMEKRRTALVGAFDHYKAHV